MHSGVHVKFKHFDTEQKTKQKSNFNNKTVIFIHIFILHWIEKTFDLKTV